MADYNEIQDPEILPEAPFTSFLGFRLRNNVVAMFQGAMGAPRLTTTALVRPTAGSTIVAKWFFSDVDEAGTQLTSYLSDSWGSCQTLNHPIWRVICNGTLRVRFQHKVSSGYPGRSYARVLKSNGLQNKVVIDEWSTGEEDDWLQRSADISVQFGDLIVIQHRTDNSAGRSLIRRAYVQADSPNIFTVP